MAFSNLLEDDDLCSGLVEEICNSRSIPFQGERIYEGSRILYQIQGKRIVKVFSAQENSFSENEAEYLKALHGKLSVTTPKLFSAGTHRGYPFLIMEKLPGSSLKSIWIDLSPWEKKRILSQIAQMLKELHSLPVEQLKDRDPQWSRFMKTQTDNLVNNHREFGLNSIWRDRIHEFIESTEAIEFSSETVLCHTEVMKEHLFLTKKNGSFNLSGLIDFEPSMVAIPEYDFCSVGLFISGGEAGLFKHFLESYGYRGSPEGIMRMLLLHRYSNMKWFISTIPDSVHVNSIEDLIHYWF